VAVKSASQVPSTERPGALVIGLVGGIGSGKSEVARLIAARGGLVIDADRIGHELLREPHIKEQVRELWGDGVFDSAGEVDRGKLATTVFSSAGDEAPGIEALNRIVHPELVRRVEETVCRARREAGVRWVVVDAALLLEWGLGGLRNVLVFVEAPEEERHRRVVRARCWSAAEVARRESSQLPLDEKRARAHRLLQNAGDREALRAQVENLLATLGGPEPTRESGGR